MTSQAMHKALIHGVAIAAATTTATIGRAAEVQFEFDWSMFPVEHEEAERLVSLGEAPIPIVFSEADPRAIVGSDLEIQPGSTVFRIGIPQLIEGPLYTVVVDTAEGVAFIEYDTLDLTTYYDTDGLSILALKIKERNQLRQELRIRESDGNYVVELPPDPYSALVNYAAKENGISYSEIVPVVVDYKNETHPPVWQYYSDSSSFLKALETASLPTVYMEYVDQRWLLSNSNVSWLLDPEPREILLLLSDPLGAEIWIGGSYEGRETEATVAVTKSAWKRIYLTMEGKVTESGRSECWVMPDQVKPTSIDGAAWIFDGCNFVDP